jgi:hypothetical protein
MPAYLTEVDLLVFPGLGRDNISINPQTFPATLSSTLFTELSAVRRCLPLRNDKTGKKTVNK